MPTPAQVKAKVKGKDALDTAGRLYGAFNILRGAVFDFADGRVMFNTASPAEQALWIAYGTEANAASSTGLAILQKSGAPKTGFDSPSPTWARLSAHYEYDSSFRQEVLSDFLSPAQITRLEAIEVQKRRDFKESRKTVTSGGVLLGNTSVQSFAQRFQSADNTALRTIAIVLMLALSPVYIAVAVFRSRRVALWPVTGEVTGINKWSESQTHTTPGVYNPQTGITTGGSSRTTTNHYDQFFIDEGGRLHTVTLRDANFAFGMRQRVTAVWAGKHTRAGNWYVCRVYNHGTREGTNVYNGLRWARGRSGGVGFVVTFVFFLLALLLAYLTNNIVESEFWQTVGTVAIIALPFWLAGSLVIRISHLFLDRAIYTRARGATPP